MIVETTQVAFDQDVQGDIPVLVDFWAPWCGPCKVLDPHLERLAAGFAGRLKVLKLNIEESPDVWKKLGMRGIPTLVLYSGGKEHSRLTGSMSAMRLQMMIQKWFQELGLAIPDFNSEAVQRDDESTPMIARRKWISFGNEAAAKEAALTRLRDHAEDKEYRPSVHLAGNQTFEVAVGAPAELGEFLDSLYITQSESDEQADHVVRAQAVELAEAIPVGADLGTVVADSLFDLLYTSPWEITQYFTGHASDLIRRIKMLHQREHKGERITATEWENVQREAILFSESDKKSSGSMDFEELASSLIDESCAANGVVFRCAISDRRRRSDWSKAEETQIETIRREIEDRIGEELGDMRMEESTREVLARKYFERSQTYESERRAEQPDLWMRYDAWMKIEQSIRSAISVHTAAILRGRLLLAAR